jgi:hypothetical protein
MEISRQDQICDMNAMRIRMRFLLKAKNERVGSRSLTGKTPTGLSWPFTGDRSPAYPLLRIVALQ